MLNKSGWDSSKRFNMAVDTYYPSGLGTAWPRNVNSTKGQLAYPSGEPWGRVLPSHLELRKATATSPLQETQVCNFINWFWCPYCSECNTSDWRIICAFFLSAWDLLSKKQTMTYVPHDLAFRAYTEPVIAEGITEEYLLRSTQLSPSHLRLPSVGTQGDKPWWQSQAQSFWTNPAAFFTS